MDAGDTDVDKTTMPIRLIAEHTNNVNDVLNTETSLQLTARRIRSSIIKNFFFESIVRALDIRAAVVFRKQKLTHRNREPET